MQINIFILLILIPLLKCLIKEEYNYILYVNLNKIIKEEGYSINKPKFNNIYVNYGDFENGVIKSRFVIYIISIFFLLLFMMKRIYIGGSNTQIKSMISFIISLVFLLLNIVYVILGFLMVLFEILSLICYFQFDLEDYRIPTKYLFN